MVVWAIVPVRAQVPIVGNAPVIDGDTIEIHGKRIRLFGIDAPESGQFCVRPSGERWRRGLGSLDGRQRLGCGLSTIFTGLCDRLRWFDFGYGVRYLAMVNGRILSVIL